VIHVQMFTTNGLVGTQTRRRPLHCWRESGRQDRRLNLVLEPVEWLFRWRLVACQSTVSMRQRECLPAFTASPTQHT
jgi:hypothetical protein